jgi:hypothetical protein
LPGVHDLRSLYISAFPVPSSVAFFVALLDASFALLAFSALFALSLLWLRLVASTSDLTRWRRLI